jgi:hypothetical protein
VPTGILFGVRGPDRTEGAGSCPLAYSEHSFVTWRVRIRSGDADTETAARDPNPTPANMVCVEHWFEKLKSRLR